jgi:TolB protein
VAIGLCLLIPTANINFSDFTTSDSDLPTALPTFTPPPIPTRPNIGRLIFTCTRGDFNQLCMINADGSDYRQITNVEAHNYYPVFSPLGGSIVYASNQNGGFFDLFLFVFDGSRLVRLTENIGNVISPSFSPDGETILFANRAAEGPTSLWTVENTGKNPKLLYTGPNTIVSSDWSPDGKTIAFAMAVDRPDAYEIFLMNADGSDIRQLTNGLPGIGGSLDWSPDGKYLLIYAGPEGDKNIYRIDVEAKTATQLTNGGNNAASSYSPDGEWIAFNSLRNDGQADLFIMRADGTDLRRITTNPEPDWQPQWEP